MESSTSYVSYKTCHLITPEKKSQQKYLSSNLNITKMYKQYLLNCLFQILSCLQMTLIYSIHIKT